ncbi:MAG: LON peptidase substrate-binding domain-containing protein, partial [Desulfobacterales bacterium]|nr:LON peptidase substrate-binding domain-containing protein [Desulfobacterales bacterium]
MINLPKLFKQNEPPKVTLPLIPLRDIVVFPYMVAPLFVGRAKSVKALSDAMNADKQVFLATQKKAGVDSPDEKDIRPIGTVGNVLQLLKLPDGTVKALVEGKYRGRIIRFIDLESTFQVEVQQVEDIPAQPAESTALSRGIIEAFDEYSKLSKNISKDLVGSVTNIIDPSHLADTVAAHFSFKMEDRLRLLETQSLGERLSALLELIRMEIEIFRMDQHIKTRVKEQMEKTQRNYYLNEQMRAIRKEMGTDEDAGDELKELEERIKAKKLSQEAEEKVWHEFKKLKMMTPMSA